jgi:N-acetylated-alpha-linked acidic dipeptidase
VGSILRISSVRKLIALFVVLGSLDAAAQQGQAWDARFRAIPEARNLEEYVRIMSARPHHLGSAYGKENAEWILARFKEWGWDAQIENYDVLFPTPKERSVEMVEPSRFR